MGGFFVGISSFVLGHPRGVIHEHTSQSLLHLDIHSVRQRQAAHRPCHGVRDHRRVGARPPFVRWRCLVHHRRRREQPEERPGRRARRHTCAGPGGSQRGRVSRAGRSAGDILRQLPAHQHRAAARGGRAQAVGGLRGERRYLPDELPRALLRGLRAVLHRGGVGRRALSRTPDAARDGRGAELLLPALPLRRAAAGADRERPLAGRAAQPQERGGELPPRRPGRPEHLAVTGAGAWLGHPSAGRSRSGHLRLVRRAGELHHRAGLRRRGRALSAAIGSTTRAAST